MKSTCQSYILMSFDVEITSDYVGLELEGVCGFSLFKQRPGIPINRLLSIIVGAPLYLENPQRYGYSLGNGYCSVPAITLLRLSRYSIIATTLIGPRVHQPFHINLILDHSTTEFTYHSGTQ